MSPVGCCNPETYLIGWKAIQAHLKEIGAGQFMGLAWSNLRRYELTMDLPVSRTRYGRALMSTVDFRRWVLNHQAKGQWWPKGKGGRSGPGWQAQVEEYTEQVVIEPDAEVPHSKE